MTAKVVYYLDVNVELYTTVGKTKKLYNKFETWVISRFNKIDEHTEDIEGIKLNIRLRHKIKDKYIIKITNSKLIKELR